MFNLAFKESPVGRVQQADVALLTLKKGQKYQKYIKYSYLRTYKIKHQAKPLTQAVIIQELK